MKAKVFCESVESKQSKTIPFIILGVVFIVIVAIILSMTEHLEASRKKGTIRKVEEEELSSSTRLNLLQAIRNAAEVNDGDNEDDAVYQPYNDRIQDFYDESVLFLIYPDSDYRWAAVYATKYEDGLETGKEIISEFSYDQERSGTKQGLIGLVSLDDKLMIVAMNFAENRHGWEGDSISVSLDVREAASTGPDVRLAGYEAHFTDPVKIILEKEFELYTVWYEEASNEDGIGSHPADDLSKARYRYEMSVVFSAREPDLSS